MIFKDVRQFYEKHFMMDIWVCKQRKKYKLKIFVDWSMFFTNLLQYTGKSLFWARTIKIWSSLFFDFIFDFIHVSVWTPANYESPCDIRTI